MPTTLLHKRFMFALFVMALVMGVFFYSVYDASCGLCATLGVFATIPHILFSSFMELPITLGVVFDAVAWFVVGFVLGMMIFRDKSVSFLKK